ncbi:MAG TPA: Crp/Fnr family transcriptional regulator [Stenomitos sp.]
MSTHQQAHPLSPNRLLASLPSEELTALQPHLEQVSLSLGQPIIFPDEPIPFIYFPLNALLSLVTVMEDGSTVEAGAIGREGMAGLPILLDAGTTPMQTLTQIPGQAVRIKAEIIKKAFDQGGALQKILHLYIHTTLVTSSQTAACNRLHHIETRLCRWLLMSSDGVSSEELALTQEFLATMLGVRRAGVSEAASQLQDQGLIRYQRGRIQIVDKKRLEASACECYKVVKAEYNRLFN